MPIGSSARKVGVEVRWDNTSPPMFECVGKVGGEMRWSSTSPPTDGQGHRVAELRTVDRIDTHRYSWQSDD